MRKTPFELSNFLNSKKLQNFSHNSKAQTVLLAAKQLGGKAAEWQSSWTAKQLGGKEAKQQQSS